MFERSNITAMVMWLLSLPFSIISEAGFLIFKKDDAYVQEQSRQALNWGITSLLIGVLASILGISLIAKILGIVHLIVCVMGIVAAREHRHYHVPFAYPFFK